MYQWYYHYKLKAKRMAMAIHQKYFLEKSHGTEHHVTTKQHGRRSNTQPTTCQTWLAIGIGTGASKYFGPRRVQHVTSNLRGDKFYRVEWRLTSSMVIICAVYSSGRRGLFWRLRCNLQIWLEVASIAHALNEPCIIALNDSLAKSSGVSQCPRYPTTY